MLAVTFSISGFIWDIGEWIGWFCNLQQNTKRWGGREHLISIWYAGDSVSCVMKLTNKANNNTLGAEILSSEETGFTEPLDSGWDFLHTYSKQIYIYKWIGSYNAHYTVRRVTLYTSSIKQCHQEILQTPKNMIHRPLNKNKIQNIVITLRDQENSATE